MYCLLGRVRFRFLQYTWTWLNRSFMHRSNSAPTTGRPHDAVAEQGRLQARRLDEYMRDEQDERDRRIVERCMAEHSAIG